MWKLAKTLKNSSGINIEKKMNNLAKFLTLVVTIERLSKILEISWFDYVYDMSVRYFFLLLSIINLLFSSV